jgi:radical SAM superfamily enzyme YgiQ (UPF0313 family)
MEIILAAVHLEDGPEAVPLGAACIAAALKGAFPGAAVSLAESFVSQGPEGLLRKIGSPGAGAVGFSLYSWNRSIMVKAAETLRARQPGLFLFAGGPEAAARPGGLEKAGGGPFDLLIRGEGEGQILRVLGPMIRGKRAVPMEPSVPMEPPVLIEPLSEAELAALPSPWLDGTLRAGRNRGALWELARGCPYSCAYCFESKGIPGPPGGRRVRYFSGERLRAELRLFVREGVPYVFVLDPTFNADPERARGILDMIEEEASGAPIHWHFEVRAELLNRPQARRFARLGASLQIGLQTASPRIAELAGRGFTLRRFLSGIKLLNEEGVIFGLDLIYGLPGDTLGGYRRSLDFALSLYPNNLDLFRLSVLPGTLFADRAAELGLLVEPDAPYNLLGAPGFPAADLERAERLSRGADLFYNQGRAVAWFNQSLRPLGLKPSAFLEGFADFMEEGGRQPEGAGAMEKRQWAYLEGRYRKAGKGSLLPALRDVVGYHTAWGKALAEGKTTELRFTYPPDRILGEEGMDLEGFVARVKPRPVRFRVGPEGDAPLTG